MLPRVGCCWKALGSGTIGTRGPGLGNFGGWFWEKGFAGRIAGVPSFHESSGPFYNKPHSPLVFVSGWLGGVRTFAAAKVAM